ncbi:MAG: hypothetical protein GX538_10290 [Gammaproteobacteria bacterium]|nr:hypothetical protein [Gammaproteobacteria bacterium]
MSWDVVQREALQAMGYELLRRVDPGAGEVPEGALYDALLRAAGRDRNSPDAAALCRSWPPPAVLRTPAGKRALWPQLRALRRRSPAR